MEKGPLLHSVKLKKERSGRLFFYILILIVVGVVLLNVINYIVSYY